MTAAPVPKRLKHSVTSDVFLNRPTTSIDASWRERLLLNSRKQPISGLANAIIAFRHAPDWAGVLAYDTFGHRTVAVAPPPWRSGSNSFRSNGWTDHDDVLAADWLQHAEIGVGVDTTQRAIEAVAMDRPFHPVHDYLNGLQWDGRQRAAKLTSAYLGADRTKYGDAVSLASLIGAVARIRQPGCKLDTVPIIEGRQGARKSTAVRTLGGEWFSDEISEFGSKDAALQAATSWFIEIAELDAMSKAETSRVKAFISRTTDRFRPPYGRRVIESKRPSVFWGTTNSDAYLRDETGARRFWPIQAGRIDIDALARDRDQLFAEASFRYDKGEPWWLASEQEHEARSEQHSRYVDDPWHDRIARHVEEHEDVSVHELLVNVLEMGVEHVTQASQNRVVACLKRLDFERYRKRVAGRSSPEWRYRRTTSNSPIDDEWERK